jgi:hypothetical protein
MALPPRRLARLIILPIVALIASVTYVMLGEEKRMPPAISGTIMVAPAGDAAGPSTQEFVFRHRESENDCGLERAADKTWCLPEGWRVTKSAIRKIAAECKSTIAEPAAANPRCVQVRAQVGGCGYESFFTGGKCKGRGHIEYELTLTAERGR